MRTTATEQSLVCFILLFLSILTLVTILLLLLYWSDNPVWMLAPLYVLHRFSGYFVTVNFFRSGVVRPTSNPKLEDQGLRFVDMVGSSRSLHSRHQSSRIAEDRKPPHHDNAVIVVEPPRRPGFKPGSGYVGFCYGQKWRWSRFSPKTSVSPANLHSICFSTIVFTITRGWHNRPGVVAVPITSQKNIVVEG
jgi:hypothetical protein